MIEPRVIKEIWKNPECFTVETFDSYQLWDLLFTMNHTFGAGGFYRFLHRVARESPKLERRLWEALSMFPSPVLLGECVEQNWREIPEVMRSYDGLVLSPGVKLGMECPLEDCASHDQPIEVVDLKQFAHCDETWTSVICKMTFRHNGRPLDLYTDWTEVSPNLGDTLLACALHQNLLEP